jgi:hypothetical protein
MDSRAAPFPILALGPSRIGQNLKAIKRDYGEAAHTVLKGAPKEALGKDETVMRHQRPKKEQKRSR